MIAKREIAFKRCFLYGLLEEEPKYKGHFDRCNEKTAEITRGP